jgi:hypothetical protein
MKIPSTLFPILFILTVPLASAFAQVNSSGRHLYVNPKAGIYKYGDGDGGLAFMLEAGKLRKSSMFSVSYFRGSQFLGDQKANALDAMYGRFFDEKKFRFEYAAGLGMFWNEYEGPETYSRDYFYKPSIPVKIGFKIFASQYTTFGLDFQAHINEERITRMIILSLEIGGLK